MKRQLNLIEKLSRCKHCGAAPALEHIYYNETWKKGIWEGWIVECGCKSIVKGNKYAAVNEWDRQNA